MNYIIRAVDGDDEADTLDELHRATSDFPSIKPEDGSWWLASLDGVPVAYAGIMQSTIYSDCGYFNRVGVLPAHRGNGLQLRLMRVIERYSCRFGWCGIVSDTTGSIHSANNFIKAGYRLFEPASPWAFQTTLYWTKNLTRKEHA